jgi:hypothetical protein
MTYVAELFADKRAKQTAQPTTSLTISVPAPPPSEPTQVTAIYPSAKTLPENQLRFYVHFSAAMSAGEAYEHIRLLTSDGKVVERAFLEIGEELWDGTAQRLTVLVDPGRIKKGLSPREQFGPVLEAGKSYILRIEPAWRDATGRPLVAAYEKRFTAGPAVESAVKTADWRLMRPMADSREPIVVHFTRPLDHPLLRRMIAVKSAAGEEIDGDISIADDERCWGFRPKKPWAAGTYQLVIDKALEDTAGNNIARPFEVDVFDRVDDSPGPEYTMIPFNVGSTAGR